MMTAAWFAYVLLVGTLLAGAACGLESVCRLAGRPVRWAWAGALALTAVLAAVAPHRSASRLAVVAIPATAPGDAAHVEVQRPAHTGIVAALERARQVVDRAVGRALAAAGERVPARLGLVAGAAWLSCSAVLVVLLVVVQQRFRRLRRAWPAAQMHGVHVRLAPEVGPAVIGLWRPEIVVPRWLLALDAPSQRLVLVHEREHVRARDPLLLAAACAAVAVFPWHPAVWWMLSRLRLAIELDCDARVLRQGVPPRSYGTLLIDLAGHGSGFRVGAAALTDKPSHLERRILAMRSQLPRFARARGGAVSAVAVLLLAVACHAELPTAAEVSGMDVAAAETRARHMLVLSPDGRQLDADYMVDGKPVSAEEARALRPEDIGSIAVQRSTQSGEKPKVVITRRGSVHELDHGPVPPGGSRLRVHYRERGDSAALARGPVGVRMEKEFQGVVLVDGARVDAASLGLFPPGDILSVEVVKGPEAAKMYAAPEAANGVIRITTRKGATAK